MTQNLNRKGWLLWVIKIGAVLFFLASVSHWLILLGIWKEESPLIISLFFNSLAVFNLLIAYGLWNLKDEGRKLGLIICTLQFPAHGWILKDQFHAQLPLETWRFIDLALCLIYLIIFNLNSIKIFFNRKALC